MSLGAVDVIYLIHS